MATSNFLSDQEQANVLAAISDAESQTSGEIRLHLESRCKGDVLDRAAVVAIATTPNIMSRATVAKNMSASCSARRPYSASIAVYSVYDVQPHQVKRS